MSLMLFVVVPYVVSCDVLLVVVLVCVLLCVAIYSVPVVSALLFTFVVTSLLSIMLL